MFVWYKLGVSPKRGAIKAGDLNGCNWEKP